MMYRDKRLCISSRSIIFSFQHFGALFFFFFSKWFVGLLIEFESSRKLNLLFPQETFFFCLSALKHFVWLCFPLGKKKDGNICEGPSSGPTSNHSTLGKLKLIVCSISCSITSCVNYLPFHHTNSSMASYLLLETQLLRLLGNGWVPFLKIELSTF